jgi:hypothetical protein
MLNFLNYSINGSYSASENKEHTEMCYDQVISLFVIPAISIFGVFSNLICMVVFSKIVLNASKMSLMLKYLLLKSISDALQLSIQSISPIFFCDSCVISKSYMAQFWYIYLFNFCEDACETVSCICMLSALIYCYKFISKSKREVVSKEWFSSFSLFVIIAILFSVLYSLAIVFRFKIEKIDKCSNISDFLSANQSIQTSYQSNGYKIITTEFYKSDFDRYLRFTLSIFRGSITSIFLFVFNFLIFYSLKRAIDRKKKLFSHKILGKKQKLLYQAEKSEHKLKILMVVSSFFYIAGHFPLSIYHLPFEKSMYWKCKYFIYAMVPFYFSYSVNIFIYYFFNKLFKINFNNLFLKWKFFSK